MTHSVSIPTISQLDRFIFESLLNGLFYWLDVFGLFYFLYSSAECCIHLIQCLSTHDPGLVVVVFSSFHHLPVRFHVVSNKSNSIMVMDDEIKVFL